jgi:hypothetical protein
LNAFLYVRIELAISNLLRLLVFERFSRSPWIKRLIEIPASQVRIISPTICMSNRSVRFGDCRKGVRCRIPSTGRRTTEAREVTIDLVGIKTGRIETIDRIVLGVLVQVNVINNRTT